ncbi:MAG: hypothetical protein IT311_05495 [Anaerolineales bacterium]|nr:hypothetical protein [Anaerolineales bacterium]MCZ2121623.1 hypothetical protein [Anaerolineales bacterium]
MKKIIYVFLLALTGCIAAPTAEPTPAPAPPAVLVSADNAYAPQPGDANLTRATVVVSSVSLIERLDLSPTRVEVNLAGSLPTTCNQLRLEVGLPNERYEINISLYSVVTSGAKCEQVLQQFEASVLLGVYSNGRYEVFINGGRVGDFIVY